MAAGGRALAGPGDRGRGDRHRSRPARGASPMARSATTCWASRRSTATGQAFSGGGRVVKNAAGYNMCRLMAGSLGTLGVITQATLMVRPLPGGRGSCWPATSHLYLAEKLLGQPDRLGLSRPAAVDSPTAGRFRRRLGAQPAVGPRARWQRGPAVRRFREERRREVEWMLDRLAAEWNGPWESRLRPCRCPDWPDET